LEQLLDAAIGNLQDLGSFLPPELLDGDEQEGLPGLRAQRRERSRRGRPQIQGILAGVLQPAREGVQETLVQTEPRRQVGEYRGIGQNGLQNPGDRGIAGHLAARQKAGEATQLREMGGYLFGERHVERRPVWRWRNGEYSPDRAWLVSGRQLRS